MSEVLERMDFTPELMNSLVKEVAALIKCTESQALVAIGTYMSERNLIPNAIAVSNYITTLKLKEIDQFSQAELNLLLELKHLRRKQFPFQPVASKIGRNDPCPCSSGRKYKQCCLSKTKLQDTERYQMQNGRPQ